ncbi:MAG: hypothetical protein RBT73_03070 [Spirochaetia bacterium]|nr:hypothetical protein [Spirochaetia bacterium]
MKPFRLKAVLGAGRVASRLTLFVVAASLVFGFGAPLYCTAQPITTEGGSGYFSTPIPLSYQGEAARKVQEKEPVLRRSLIIAAGSFPFSYFYTNLAFDLVRYAVSGFNSLYAPWPFRPIGSVSIDSKETFIRLGVGAGLSLAIGLADILSR